LRAVQGDERRGWQASDLGCREGGNLAAGKAGDLTGREHGEIRAGEPDNSSR
jgi:hypothetical protein